MPKLVRLYISQVLIGFGVAALFVGALLWMNVANLWHLVTHSDQGLLAVFLLWFLNGIVFAGVQFGIAIMRLSSGQPPSGTRRPRIGGPIPVRAEATAPRPQQRRR